MEICLQGCFPKERASIQLYYDHETRRQVMAVNSVHSLILKWMIVLRAFF